MIYLISANSYHLVDDELNKIFDNLDDVEIVDFNKTTIEDIITSINYVSLFNDEKKMIVKNANFFLSKNSVDTKILEKYLDNPNPNSILVFVVYDKVDERKKITKTIKDKYNYVCLKPLSPKDIIDKIISIFKGKKYSISYDNAKYIAYNCLNNYDLVINEINKVFLYYLIPQEVKYEDLENIISKTMEDNNFKFIDAVIDKNLKSLDILKDLKIQKVEPLILLTLLAREYRLMLIAKDMYQKNISKNVIASELKLQDWQIDKVITRSYNYSIKELENKLISLTDLDYKIKSGNVDKYLGLELFILND